MKYYTKMHTESEEMQITKDEARIFLEETLDDFDTINDVINNEKPFRIHTSVRNIWTMTDDGLVPMPGFYGICG